MAVSKLTMFLQIATGDATANPAAIRVGGWSESWYDDQPISDQLKKDFRNLCAARAALLPRTGVIVAQRYQNIDPPGPALPELNRFPGNNYACDYPSLALLCRVPGVGVVNTRPMYLRGIPDAMITLGEFTPTAPYQFVTQAFFRALNLWNFRAQVLGVNVPIINIEADGTVTTEAALTGVAVRSAVRVVRTNITATKRSFGGKFFVDTVTNDSVFKLKNWTVGECDGGSIRLYSILYPNIDGPNISTGRIVTKKVGRPFEVFHGKKSAKKPK